MRHRAPKQINCASTPQDAPLATTRFSRLGQATRSRKLAAVTATMAALAGSGIAVAIGTSVAAPRAASVATNLIANPGFESGLAGWGGPAVGVSVGTAAHSGHNGAILRSPMGLPAPAAATATSPVPKAAHRAAPSTTLTLTSPAATSTKAAAVYHAAVWLAAPSGRVRAVLRIRELQAGRVVRQRVTKLVVANGTWHQLALDYTAQAPGDTLSFSVTAADMMPGRNLQIDDAWLALVNVPTATATASVTDTATPTGSPSNSPSPSITPSSTPSSTPRAGGPPLIGSSFGGSIATTEAAFPNMQVARFFYPGAPAIWGGSIATIPTSQVIFVSFNYNVATTVAGGSDAAFTQVLRSWAATGRTIYWTWQHEADNPAKGISQTDYRDGWARLLADASAVNAPNVHSMSIIMATALTGVHGPVEGWYVPVDVLGFDCYFLNTELLAEQYALGKGKPVAFPEFGSGLSGSADSAAATFARQFIAALDSNTIAAAWYNNNMNSLATRPQTLAVLRAAAG